MTAARFLLVSALSYVLGISIAAAVNSLAGGSTPVLIIISLVVGAPFAATAALLGVVYRKAISKHLLVSMVAVPPLTGAVWFALGLGLGDIFNETRVGLYAVFCSACCATIAYLWLRHGQPEAIGPSPTAD